MNISRAFVTYLEGLTLGTFLTDIFIGAAPLNASDRIFWIVAGGGAPISKNSTGEKQKNYTLNVYYRNTDAEDVYDTLQSLEESINSDQCTELPGYEMIEMSTTVFPTDQDLDAQDRTVGLLQVTLTTYL